MDFLRNGMQSVSRYININLFPYSMVNYTGNFVKPHIWNGCGREYSQHESLRSCHGEGVWSLCISLCTIYFSICAFGIKLCMPECPAVLAWLHFQVPSVRKSTCYCFFTRVKQLCTFPTIFGNPSMANTGNSTVDGDMEQLFSASGPLSMHHMCSYACAKGFQLWTWK